jgi:molybdopterin/thiamine biosynthesis adenylyltransferase
MLAPAANLPPLTEVDWQLVSTSRVVLVGAGAVGRPLVRGLAQLGLRRAVIVDPKAYRERSVLSQCGPKEVGRLKAEVVAEELAGLGVSATALARDVEHVPPGYFADALVIVSVDNRRAEILVNRHAGRMGRPLLKVNIEPLFLTASLRFVDFSQSAADVCLECQMTDAHYAAQQHPLSCDGEGPGRPTASPRPLCELAANAGALVAAQLLGSPQQWASVWRNRQWQTNLLGGQTQISQLPPNAHCRWDHATRWSNLTGIHVPLVELTLARLLELSGLPEHGTPVRLSGTLATRLRCETCPVLQHAVRAIGRLDVEPGRCACGGALRAVPFYCFDQLPAADLAPWRDQPLAAWGIEPQSIISLGDGSREVSYLLTDGRTAGFAG